ncbi:MAG: response regulator [Elusimicrobia bacterium]|nr:response regulator [Elusimicrobiota bacterium]
MPLRLLALIVDDDFSSRVVLAIALRQAGFEVRTAASSQEALTLLQSEPFLWLITDGDMGSVSGYDLSREARRIYPNLRIAMISALSAGPRIQDFPIEKAFVKPVAVEEVISWMRAPPANA